MRLNGLDMVRVGMGAGDQIDIVDRQGKLRQAAADMVEIVDVARVDQDVFLLGADQVGVAVVCPGGCP